MPPATSETVRLRPVTSNGEVSSDKTLPQKEEELCADVFGANHPGSSDSNKDGGVRTENEEIGNTLLTNPDLIKEEEELRIKNEKKDKEEEAKIKKEEDDEMNPQDRYKKLTELLSKSKFYSNFLLEKMEREDEESKNLKNKNLSGRKSSKSKKNESSEPANKKKKYQHERTYNGEPIPDDQPLLLSGGIMRDYQLKGYQWMATLYENGINGILADEMGLGKTIQTIALFAHLVEMGVPGPFMVIAPLSTISNWVREFNKFAPMLPVVLYHGSAKEREALRNTKIKETIHLDEEDGLNGGRKVRNCFVTSYEIAMNDQQHFKKVRWLYMVVDEGHRLKNMHCRLIKSLKLYTSSNRLLLTGTPLQNNLDELWSLLNFLMSEIFDDLRVFRSWFDAKDIHHDESETDRILRQEQQNSILSTLHQILTPFLLRRVKSDVDLKIPPKKEVLVYCPLTEKQRTMYEATVSKTIQDLVGTKKKEEVMGIFKHDKIVGHTGDLSEERTKRSAATNINYSEFLDINPEGGERSFKKYCDKMREVQKELEARERSAMSCNGYNNEEQSKSAEINYSVKSRLMDLRKTCNHPYLIEYPLTDDGLFYRSDEAMVDICGKLKVLDQMLTELLKRKHKVLIFSQMTKLLDILADYLAFRELKFSRLDGAMHFEDRQANIDQFNSQADHNVFLLSTRAGGLGINLTAADTVIIYDSDWNPQQDLQAQDRAHRIGQTKPVMVYRMVTANTIDERIVERAAAKRKLEKMIIHKNKFKSQDTAGLKTTMQTITPQELLELLNSKDHAGVIDRKDQSVFTKEELDMLLDRSDLTWEKLAEKQNLEESTGKKKKKQTENFGYSSLSSEDESKNRMANKKAAKHFKVIDTEGLPQGLQSVK